MGNLRRVFAASAAVLLLAACTGGDVEPSDTPSAVSSPTGSVSATASPTPTLTPTGAMTTEELLAVLPAGAGEPDVQGAIVTAEYFVGLYGEMLRTGDTRVWDALSGPECEFCWNASSTIGERHSESLVIEGGTVTVQSGRTRGNLNDDGLTYVGLVATQDRAETTTGDLIANGGTFGTALRMKFVDGVWRVLELQIVEPEDIA